MHMTTVRSTLARYFSAPVWVLALVMLFPTPSSAATIGLCDTDGPGTCVNAVSLSGTTLTITLTNTSSAVNGGFVTAEAFNLAGNVQITGFTTTDTDFSLFLAVSSPGGAFNVQPFGQREFLISAQGATFEGGGKPKGLAPGETVTFTLTLDSATGITESAVLASEVLRFRGFTDGSTDGGSDKDQVTRVPEPSSTVLLLISLSFVGLLASGWRRQLHAA